MTANESETSAGPSDRADSADEELWLTYQNYDQSIQQAVRRLGALSTENVDLFRNLLLKSRDRSKVKEYEAESIRRLQGEAFVGDEELQRTLIVLTAENPRFGEELKRLVAAGGKPSQLDQVVAAIQSGKETSVKPSRAADPSPSPEQPREAVVVPLHKDRPAAPAPRSAPAPRAVPAPRPGQREDVPATKQNLKWPVVIGGVLLVAVAAGLVLGVPGLITGNNSGGNDRIAAVPPAAKPQAAAPSAAPAPVRPATAVDIAIPAQADKNAPSSPLLRPASTQPEAPSGTQPDVSSAPVAGSKYRVVRGDMLSDIALRVYGDASKFRLIQAANPNIRNKPDRILVDQVIFIPQLSR